MIVFDVTVSGDGEEGDAGKNKKRSPKAKDKDKKPDGRFTCNHSTLSETCFALCKWREHQKPLQTLQYMFKGTKTTVTKSILKKILP